MKHDESFGTGAARVGWLFLLLLLLIGVAGLLSTFSGTQLAAGAVGAGVIAVGVALGAQHGPKHPDGGRVHNRR